MTRIQPTVAALLVLWWLMLFESLGPTAPCRALAACPEPPQTDQGGRKGLTRRNFPKALRHELHLFGGLYASDVMGAAPQAGASYTFHFSEDFGLEVAFAYTRFSSALREPIERRTGYTLLKSHDARIYHGNLVWHPIHGKFMLFRSSVPHFDIFFTAGAGVTDSRTARGLTYSLGTGLKIFITSWMSLRLTIRDYVYAQEVLGSTAITNNLSVTLGVGFWIPFSG